MPKVTIAPNIFEWEYSEFSCRNILEVTRSGCKIIEGLQLCDGQTELIDNVIAIVDGDGVQIRRVNQVTDEVSAPVKFLGGLL